MEIETSTERDIGGGQHIHILPGGQQTGPSQGGPGHRHVLPGGYVTRVAEELELDIDDEFEEQETDSIVIR